KRHSNLTLYPHAHEARLVQIVIALKRLLAAANRPATNQAAFKALLQMLKKRPAPQWRYGRIKKATALTQAYKGIPKRVRSNPAQFIPSPQSSLLESAPQLTDSSASIVAVSLNFLARIESVALPPVPTSLDG